MTTEQTAPCACPTCVPLDVIPVGWKFISCIRAATDDGEWWVQLEGPPKPWPVRTSGAWGPTLRAAVERAAWEAAHP
jgi:hypothetical protein